MDDSPAPSMLTRTIRKTVTFTHAFTLGDFDEVLPPGDYEVETDEELLQGLSFQAYRRVLAVIRIPSSSGDPRLSRALTIDPNELDAAILKDQQASEADETGPSDPRVTEAVRKND